MVAVPNVASSASSKSGFFQIWRVQVEESNGRKKNWMNFSWSSQRTFVKLKKLTNIGYYLFFTSPNHIISLLISNTSNLQTCSVTARRVRVDISGCRTKPVSWKWANASKPQPFGKYLYRLWLDWSLWKNKSVIDLAQSTSFSKAKRLEDLEGTTVNHWCT